MDATRQGDGNVEGKEYREPQPPVEGSHQGISVTAQFQGRAYGPDAVEKAAVVPENVVVPYRVAPEPFKGEEPAPLPRACGHLAVWTIL
jgi:hypothetical protein